MTLFNESGPKMKVYVENMFMRNLNRLTSWDHKKKHRFSKPLGLGLVYKIKSGFE